MKNIYLNIYKPNLDNLKKAKKNIENDNVIGMPTETVYGLAGNAYSDKSVSKIFTLKKRPTFNPLIIHFRSLKDLKNDAILNENFTKLYKAFCPGPITFILKKKPKSIWVIAGTSLVSAFLAGGAVYFTAPYWSREPAAEAETAGDSPTSAASGQDLALGSCALGLA